MLGYMEDPDITTPPRPAASAGSAAPARPGAGGQLPRARGVRGHFALDDLPGGDK